MYIYSTSWLLADECLLYRVINSQEVSNYFNLITEWCKCWLIKQSLDKCVIIQCNYGALSPVLISCSIESHALDNVNQGHYLAVILDKI